MRALHCRLPSTPYLPFCHLSLLSLKSPFLTLPIPPNQYPSLQNSHTPLGHSLRPRTIITAPMASTPSTTEAVTEKETKPFSVLFVCLGNICRSPAAEGVFTDLVKKRGLDSNFTIDSAGTIDYHEGNEADPRMRAAAKRRGIQITSMSRPIRPTDFRDFNLILAMDKQNKGRRISIIYNVGLMCSYCKKHDESEVPDPYYGGPQGFEKRNLISWQVLDLLEDACESLLDSILAENSRISDS
ncbi:hypothetical protein RHMOL_Rhmol13G0138000 [Rhododendron molle]|uniref:Uncharacterized protein n=1 Tax=Rhododendron molle TaxID=49168 RepID=A0ACC0L6Y4_RHOML|nr:hypothetical protein RHMOL_Rhmol13G0138000 [Rhododendron molle]